MRDANEKILLMPRKKGDHFTMYICPQCDTFKELQERLAARETFRVYKRKVRDNSHDKSYREHGRSHVILNDRTEVEVLIFKGKVVSAVAVEGLFPTPAPSAPPQTPQTNTMETFINRFIKGESK
jgi:hypothetical protein